MKCEGEKRVHTNSVCKRGQNTNQLVFTDDFLKLCNN